MRCQCFRFLFDFCMHRLKQEHADDEIASPFNESESISSAATGIVGLFLGVFFLNILWFRLFLSQDNDVIDIFRHPFAAVSKLLLILANTHTGLSHIVFLPVVFRQDIVHGFLRHGTQRVFHEARHAELPFHQVSHNHHKLLRESLESKEIRLHAIQVLTVALDAHINFLEEIVGDTIDFREEFLAAVFLTQPQLVVHRWHMQRLVQKVKL